MMKPISLILPFSCLLSLVANSQDFLETSIVTAARFEQSLDESVQAVDVITGEELLEGSVRTVPEALGLTPGVMVQKTTHGHGSPFIRGFTGRQNLLMVDGVRINNSSFRSGPIQYWNTLDSQGVDRLELVKGTGSVLYGSDAIGGVLNVISESTGMERYEGGFSYGSLYYRYDTNSQSHVGRLEQAIGVGGDWGLKLGVSRKEFGDIEDSAVGVFENTGYPELNVDFKLEKTLAADSLLSFAFQSVDQDEVWRWHSTTLNQGWVHGSHVTEAGSNRAQSAAM